MGCRELIESLRKEGDEKVLSIWREAEDEAGSIFAGISLRLEAERSNSTVQRTGDEMQRSLLLEAETKAKLVRLTSEDNLARRLYSLAVSSLHLLRNEHYENTFERLVQELPSAKWRSVRVNPADRGIAEKCFPGMHIVSDSSIAGGMEAETEEGRIRIINTFEKRLERSWPLMLPEIFNDLAKVLGRDGTAQED